MALKQERQREVFRTQSDHTMMQALYGETQELLDAFDQMYVTQDAEVNFVGELGDVLIFGLRLAWRNNVHFDPEDVYYAEDDDPLVLAGGINLDARILVEGHHILPEPQNHVLINRILDNSYRLCQSVGVDPLDAIEYKLMRNAYKYPDHFLSNGWDTQTAIEMSKSLHKYLGKDHKFNLWYQDHFGGEA